MSTKQLCERAGLSLDDNDNFQPMPRRRNTPMPVHRSGAACRAASRANSHTSRRRRRTTGSFRRNKPFLA